MPHSKYLLIVALVLSVTASTVSMANGMSRFAHKSALAADTALVKQETWREKCDRARRIALGTENKILPEGDSKMGNHKPESAVHLDGLKLRLGKSGSRVFVNDPGDFAVLRIDTKLVGVDNATYRNRYELTIKLSTDNAALVESLKLLKVEGSHATH